MDLQLQAINRENIKSTTLARKIYLQRLKEMSIKDNTIQKLEVELNRLKYR